ncbi:hypothetical protein MA16_Dca018577 [Dendrobium catenatum]|uniref:Uncharacterized protein n=1 Tax=Dendrobium catenatum TaxID=906689 RepID=A0A2I0XCS7_9ASPA|nr:hypothetical protein MA16_Dca018577 [Dendrobium catenatum]
MNMNRGSEVTNYIERWQFRTEIEQAGWDFRLDCANWSKEVNRFRACELKKDDRT